MLSVRTPFPVLVRPPAPVPITLVMVVSPAPPMVNVPAVVMPPVPAFYTKPVTAQKKWMAVPNGHLLPYDCAEEGWRQHLEQLERAGGGK